MPLTCTSKAPLGTKASTYFDFTKSYYTRDHDKIVQLNKKFSSLRREYASHIANVDIDNILLEVINAPSCMKEELKALYKKLLENDKNIVGSIHSVTELIAFLSPHWDELKPNLLFFLIDILNIESLTKKALEYQTLIGQVCDVIGTDAQHYGYSLTGSMYCLETEYMVILSDGDIDRHDVARRKINKSSEMQTLKEHESLLEDQKHEFQNTSTSKSVILDVQIIKRNIRCSQHRKLGQNLVKLDIKSKEKSRKYYLEEIEEFMKESHYGTCIWFLGHSEKSTGNWYFKDGTISFEDVYKIYMRVAKGKLLTIVSDCSYSGKWVCSFAEILDKENIHPCGHNTNVKIRIYASAGPSQEAQELCYSIKGVKMQINDGDFSFLDVSLGSGQHTCHGDFTKLVCCRGPDEGCGMVDTTWTWADLVTGDLQKSISLYTSPQYQNWKIVLPFEGYKVLEKGSQEKETKLLVLESGSGDAPPEKVKDKVKQCTLVVTQEQ